MADPTIPAFLTVRQVADRLVVSCDIVRALIANGKLPASDVAASSGKKRWRVALADLEQFLAGRRNVTLPKPARRRRGRDLVYKYF
jgi:excisionase family DNA binding protein